MRSRLAPLLAFVALLSLAAGGVRAAEDDAYLGVVFSSDQPITYLDGQPWLPAAPGGRLTITVSGRLGEQIGVELAGRHRGWKVISDTANDSRDHQLTLRWIRTAKPLSVAVTATSGERVTGVRRIDINLSEQGPVVEEMAIAESSAGTTLTWREDMANQLPAVSRRLTSNVTEPDPQRGCVDWRPEASIDLPVPDEQASLPPVLGQAPETTTDLHARRLAKELDVVLYQPVETPVTFDPLGRLQMIPSDDGEEKAAPAATMQEMSFLLPAALAEHCYRLTLELANALGQISSESVVITPGLVSYGDRALPVWEGGQDLYFPGAFVSQQTLVWCVAASSQMMTAMINQKAADDSFSTQRKFISYGHRRDGGDYGGLYSGTDARGWVAMVKRWSSAKYDIVRDRKPERLLREAARRMRISGRPAGVLVMNGDHAWVLHGFEASSDPALSKDFRVTALYVSGPLWPRKNHDKEPDTRMSPDTFAHYFRPAYGGLYVAVVPSLDR